MEPNSCVHRADILYLDPENNLSTSEDTPIEEEDEEDEEQRRTMAALQCELLKYLTDEWGTVVKETLMRSNYDITSNVTMNTNAHNLCSPPAAVLLDDTSPSKEQKESVTGNGSHVLLRNSFISVFGEGIGVYLSLCCFLSFMEFLKHCILRCGMCLLFVVILWCWAPGLSC